MGEPYNGPDRRASSPGDTQSILLKHLQEEMENKREMLDRIEAHKEHSDKRHDETQERISHLTQSIEAFIHGSEEFQSSVIRAFPKTDDGRPDVDGHRNAHLAWINDAKEAKAFKLYVRNVVVSAVAVAVLMWLWAVVWPAFLLGPK